MLNQNHPRTASQKMSNGAFSEFPIASGRTSANPTTVNSTTTATKRYAKLSTPYTRLDVGSWDMGPRGYPSILAIPPSARRRQSCREMLEGAAYGRVTPVTLSIHGTPVGFPSPSLRRRALDPRLAVRRREAMPPMARVRHAD